MPEHDPTVGPVIRSPRIDELQRDHQPRESDRDRLGDTQKIEVHFCDCGAQTFNANRVCDVCRSMDVKEGPVPGCGGAS